MAECRATKRVGYRSKRKGKWQREIRPVDSAKRAATGMSSYCAMSVTTPGTPTVSSRCYGKRCPSFPPILSISRFVPDGDWFCPKCVHGMLIEKMEEVAKVLDENLKKKAVEEKKKKAAADRLRREMEYIGVSLNNIIPTTVSSFSPPLIPLQFKETAIPSSSSSSDEDTTQRKSKRKAVKYGPCF